MGDGLGGHVWDNHAVFSNAFDCVHTLLLSDCLFATRMSLWRGAASTKFPNATVEPVTEWDGLCLKETWRTSVSGGPSESYAADIIARIYVFTYAALAITPLE